MGLGGLSIADGNLMVNVATKNAEGLHDGTFVQVSLKDFSAFTAYSIDRYVSTKDAGVAARDKFRKDTEKALLAGAVSVEKFDLLFGEGEAAKVKEEAAKKEQTSAATTASTNGASPTT